MPVYRIVLADQQAAFRRETRKILALSRDLEVVAEVENGRELLESLPGLSAQLVILDLALEQPGGLEVLRRVKSSYPDLKVLILTSRREKESLQQAFRTGADGYLLKEEAPQKLRTAIKTVRRGKVYLSPRLAAPLAELYIQNLRRTVHPPAPGLLTRREIEILTLTVEGKTSKEIAARLFLSFRTVQNHRANILRKLQLRKTVDLVRYALCHGYAPAPRC